MDPIYTHYLTDNSLSHVMACPFLILIPNILFLALVIIEPFIKAGATLWNKLPTHITSSPTLSSFKEPILHTHMTFKHASPYFKTFIKLLVCKAH